MSFVGAGFLGFAHTIPQVNMYTHGTLVTAMHGHMAFWGAYAMLVLASSAYAMPLLTGRKRHDTPARRFAFWTSNIGMIAMTLAFAVAGISQVVLERRSAWTSSPCRRRSRSTSGASSWPRAVHPRHRRVHLQLHPPRQAGGGARGARRTRAARSRRRDRAVLPRGRRRGRAFTAAHATHAPVLLKGPTGCGKSRFVEAMAARLDRPLVTVACNDETSAHDLLGRWLVKGGDTVWQDGPVTRAVKPARSCTSTRWPRRART
jgi:hypothetical protein